MKPMNQRQTQVAEEIRSIIAPALLRGEIPTSIDLSRVTVTNVWSSADLRLARIYVVFPEGWKINPTLKILNAEVASPLRKALSKRLATKYLPDLSFFASENDR